MKGHCILSHGFESGPDATKVTALAEVAQCLGYSHERPDYTDLDSKREVTPLGDVQARIARLLALSETAARRGPVVLAGSSLGAYISGFVSLQVPVIGLYFMAPPVIMTGAPPMPAASVPTSVIHGWHDELIPAAQVVEWAGARDAQLLLVNDGHRLTDHVQASADAFAALLARVDNELEERTEGARFSIRQHPSRPFGALLQGLQAMKFFASCGKGLEYLLADELQALGCARATATMAGANVEGTLEDGQRAVLWSRLASRVLWPIAEFDCADEHALYAGACAVEWAQHIGPMHSIAIDAHVSGAAITHARYAAQRVKDAIVDVLRQQTGQRPDVDVEAPDVRISLVLRKGRALLSIDLSGGPMHRRGWRKVQGLAPLKETVAAAVLLRGGWPKVYAEGGDLLDPMCGSGTLLIEGALMAADVAPGLRRHGGLPPTRWLGFDVASWQTLCAEARQRAQRGLAMLRPCFHGSDLDPHAIRAARENAENAEVREAIGFSACDIAALPAQANPQGVVVCNPPYDARLQADPALYRALGDGLKLAAPNWRAALLCGDAELARATGLRAKKSYQIFNGAIECSLIAVDPITPPQREGGEKRALPEGAQMVANRVRKNLDKLARWRQQEQVTCFRAYDADIPEYACAVDVYTTVGGDTWLHVQEYAAPAEIPEATTRKRLNDLLLGVREVFGLPKERVAVKTRSTGKGGSKYGHFDHRGEFLTVEEGSARLQVNLFDYLDTGLFLDHRPLRAQMAREARGKRFLNLFCYTGVASVQAAVQGALETTSVDLSATYLEWLADNLRGNGIGGTRHRIAQADALRWLEADRGQYDVIFCDPPTFSNSKRANDFDVQRDHVRLLRAALARLAAGGVLYFSNNFRRFKLDADALAEVARIEDISAATIPPDFARNGKIHRAWRISAR